MEKLGCGLINCDKLGHEAYLPGTQAHGEIVREFGEGVLGEGGLVNRKALGALVFKDKSKLEMLNKIVCCMMLRSISPSLREPSKSISSLKRRRRLRPLSSWSLLLFLRKT